MRLGLHWSCGAAQGATHAHSRSGGALARAAAEPPPPPLRAPPAERVQVGESQAWLRSRQADVEAHAAQTLEYDW